MKLKNSKNNLERNVAVFEMFLMVLSVGTFSYLIGKEIGLVSADGIPVVIGEGPGGEFLFGPGEALLDAPSGALATIPYPAAGGTSYSVFGSSGVSWRAGAILENAGTALKGIAQSAIIAALLYFGTKYIGQFLGLSEQNANELAKDLGLGYLIGGGVGALALAFGPSSWAWLGQAVLGHGLFAITPAGIIGTIIGAIIFALWGYRDYRAYLVTFNCLPWQPKSGGQYCEECNKPLFGTDIIQCSKYRCESLGSGCKIVDVGEEEEMCYWENKNDVTAPEIVAWDDALSEGFRYNPNIAKSQYIDGGVTIEYIGSADGCIPPYQRFNFGVTLNKIGYCKIDSNRTTSYDNMKNALSLGYANYNHTILMALEGAINEDGDLEQPNKNVELYVKCESTGGYSNDRSFVFKYCVQNELNLTAPIIMNAEPQTKSPIKQGTTEQSVKIYVNKPSTCKWSYNDESYEAMQNTMGGSDIMGRYGYYEYTTTFTGLKDLAENKFYINCKSYPALEETDKESQRRAMAENYKYILVGTKGLVIDSVKPNDTIIKDSTENVKVTISAKTSQGYKDGESYCSIKESEASAAVPFFSDLEPTYQHTQDLYLISGDYSYEITCCDIGLNCDTKTVEFSVETDFEAPMVVRAYNEGNSLKLITNEKAECVYDTTSCNYEFENGVAVSSSDNIEHTLNWDTENTFYIKCKDEFDGQPAADQCTIIVRPSDTF
jgi:hypothetical protein